MQQYKMFRKVNEGASKIIMNFDNNTYTIKDSGKVGVIALVLGVVFLGISVLGYLNDSAHFFFNYLTAYIFWLSIALGGMFMTMVHHVTNATWSTVIRRITENMAGTMPVFVLLFIPIIFGLHELFHWSHAGVMDPSSQSFDHILYEKQGYLNETFFYIRAFFYLAVWTVFSYLLRKKSIQQDSTGKDYKLAFKKLSAPWLILFALTTTFASFDWMMSLDAHWFSTIFGVYFFSGVFLSGLTFLLILLIYLRSQNILQNVVTIEHYQDIAKFMFAFIIFWSYMAFSQYFLIWYANLPEENYWFLYRWDNTWQNLSLLLIFGHFVFPFIALITRAAKRNVKFLLFMSAWILLMRFVDLYWIIMPTGLNKNGSHVPFDFGIYDIAPIIGIGGIFVWFFWKQFTANAIVPIKDASLNESMKFQNT